MSKLYHVIYTTLEDTTPVLLETYLTHHQAHRRIGQLCNFRGNENQNKIYDIVEEENEKYWLCEDSGCEMGFI
jgi:hypothetical protein